MYRVLLLVVSAVLSSVYAQATGPCDPLDPAPDCEDYDPDAPIDGGASILIAAGVAYGVKKIHDKRKAKAQEEMI